MCLDWMAYSLTYCGYSSKSCQVGQLLTTSGYMECCRLLDIDTVKCNSGAVARFPDTSNLFSIKTLYHPLWTEKSLH